MTSTDTTRERIELPGGWSLRNIPYADQEWSFYDDEGRLIMGYCRLRFSAERFAAAMNSARAALLAHMAVKDAEITRLKKERDAWAKAKRDLQSQQYTQPWTLNEAAQERSRAKAEAELAALRAASTAPRPVGSVPEELVELYRKSFDSPFAILTARAAADDFVRSLIATQQSPQNHPVSSQGETQDGEAGR